MNKVQKSLKNILRFTTLTVLSKKILKDIQCILDSKGLYL